MFSREYRLTEQALSPMEREPIDIEKANKQRLKAAFIVLGRSSELGTSRFKTIDSVPPHANRAYVHPFF